MLSRWLLTGCLLFSCCAAPTLAQLPKRLERCLPNPTLAQEIQDMYPPEPEKPTVNLRVVRMEFDPASRIPQEIQDEISKNEVGRTLEMDADSDYLNDHAIELAEVPVRGALQNAGYFRVLTEAKLTVFKREGPKIDVVAHVSAEIGDQYRVGKIRFVSADSEKEIFYTTETLREKILLERGELFNVDKIRAGLRDLTSMYGEDGYIDFTAEPEFFINDETKIIDLTLRLDLQKQYRIREIEFWGVKPELEQRLRVSYQQSGEVFNKRRMEQFLQENIAILPRDVKPDEVVEIHRDEAAGLIGILFDFRTCAGILNATARAN